MRLKRFSVEKLFGFFDHVVPLNLDERVTILHAPNGYGKTVILKLISGFFSGSLEIFRQTEFEKVIFQLDNGETVTVQQGDQQSLFPDSKRDPRSFQIVYVAGGQEFKWDPFAERDPDNKVKLPASWTSRSGSLLLPTVQNILSNEVASVERSSTTWLSYYWDTLFSNRLNSLPDWLVSLRASLTCRLIETQRLQRTSKKQGTLGESEDSELTPTVEAYARELANSIGRLLAESATFAQSLDQSFPTRLLEKMKETKPSASEEELRHSLKDLEAQRVRLSNCGLLAASDTGTLTSHDEFNETTRRLLAEYIDDTKKKLSVYDSMLAKLELFTEILNDRFQFKQVHIDKNQGFDLRDVRGRPLPASSLSSGEQHELVLLYELLFRTDRNSLILIDEPEISLHVAWQKRFLHDLRRIIELGQIDTLISTHSPQLIGSNIDLCVPLRAPKDVLRHS